MLAILAAVPFETAQLRRRLAPCEVRDCAGRELFLGKLAGEPLLLLHCGIGKANAAAAAAVLIESYRPSRLLLIGCGGAMPQSGLAVGDLALASGEIFGDEGVAAPGEFLDFAALGLPLLSSGGQHYYNRYPVDDTWFEQRCPRFTAVIEAAGSKVARGPFVTVSTCSGTLAGGLALGERTGAICENMEGAAVAQVALRRGIPFCEIRGISNLVEDRDLTRWDLRRGAACAEQAVWSLLSHPEEAVPA